jgi:hypothetical protein
MISFREGTSLAYLFARPLGVRFRLSLSVLAVCLWASACKDLGEEPPVPVPVINVTVRNTETFQRFLVGGDEDGARIITQAQHFRVSEVRMDASTNWGRVYFYQPEAGYVGSDYTELELETNSRGTVGKAQVSKLGLRFTVTN